jgi:hypothetical protein
MFEIGSSLREARERQKLELRDVERETRIRAKYLQALEAERFDVLPGSAYVKGFLRTYADHLGLDAQRFMDEYETRFAPEDVLQAALPVLVRRPRRSLHARLVAIPVVAAVALLVWRTTSGGGGHHHAAAAQPPAPHVKVSTVTRTRPVVTPARATKVQLALVAARGPCWVSVRLGSETGRTLYEGTLEQGRSARFAGARMWIRLGAPWNLDATLNGKDVELPGSVANILVTRAGFNTQS